YRFDKSKAWSDIGCNQVVLQRDTAFELSGTGFNLITSSETDDEIIVVGDEPSDIAANRSFARISIVSIEDEADEQKAYNLIRKIEYVKYHCFPDGYMMRTSSSSHKEAVRVAKYAVKAGIDFKAVGNLFISKYKEIPSVRGVKIIFVTAPSADYSSLAEIAEKNNEITKTLNHVMNSVNFDCNSCNLKAVCDEVEGMRELHFGNSNNMK
ncbi:MAG: carbon monoxide dehydrogenase, partial [Clostridia bacterium]|nr:carbon monoxide dehydrogenase [Clostridia bacterium]